MHDRTKPPATYRLHAAPLRYQVDATKPRFRFRSSYAVRKRRQRDRDALELKQFTIELHEHRLERALTADVMTDVEALDNAKVKAAIALQSASLTMGGSRCPCALPFFADRLIVERAALLYSS